MQPNSPVLILTVLIAALCTNVSVVNELQSPSHGNTALGRHQQDSETVRQALTDYHTGADKSGAVLRVVYFRPANVDSQSEFRPRITRIMFDMQDFLKTEMNRNGFADAVLPLELDGKYVRIHEVVGRDDADGYSHDSGQKVQREVQAALRDRFSVRAEYVLIFNGMCRIEAERKYFFYAPYYGDPISSHQRGLCHVADCEILDPVLLTDTKRMMSYREHNGSFTQSVADFNSKYLGGVIHELGHGLSLPHNGQTPGERNAMGNALMGFGNHTYRKEVWSDSKGTFLTFASAVRLASHPLFTGSNRGREIQVRPELKNLKFEGTGNKLIVSGEVSESRVRAHSVILYVDPPGRGGYDAVTTVASVDSGHFEVEGSCLRSGPHDLRLVTCHVNGATSTQHFTMTVGDGGVPDRKSIKRSQKRR